MINLTLNDKTQKEIIKHLKVTEMLLSNVATKLSLCKKEALITAMPDLGISHNITRMMGGFFTGACYSWESDIPFIPIDATVNVCGTAIYKLSKEIPINKFISNVNKVINDKSRYTWNYTNGNHFVILAESKEEYGFEKGYYMIVHASANEYKYGVNGLYPSNDIWYQKYIKTEYDKNSNRYLRYIEGDYATRFYDIAKDLIEFNRKRNRYFVKKVLNNEFYEKEILNINHYGMPNNHSICIGAHWDCSIYPLLTSFSKPIYIIKPNKDTFNYSPHGLGLYLENPKIEFTTNGITIGKKKFFLGDNITIGTDAINRCNLPSDDTDKYASSILDICKGNIIGKLHQIVSISKDGTKVFKKKRDK